MKLNKKTADFALIITAIIWGTGFIGTQFAIDSGAKTSLIVALRFLFASSFMLIFLWKHLRFIPKKTLFVGSIAGVLLFFGFYLQTFGQSMTTVSNSSLLTSTNVLMIPFIVWCITRKNPNLKFFILALIAFLGMLILTFDFKSGFSFKIGDIFVLLSALLFALHISYLGIFGKGHNTIQTTFLQLFVCGILAFIVFLVTDLNTLSGLNFKSVILPTLYLGIFSTLICYFLQTTAQQVANPSKTGIILSLEGFFGTLFAVILGMDKLTPSILIGGFLILLSVILSEVDFKQKLQ